RRLARPRLVTWRPGRRRLLRAALGLHRQRRAGRGRRAVALRRANRGRTGAALTAQLYMARPTSLLDAVVSYPPGAFHPVTTLTTDDLAGPRRRYGERPWDPRLIATIERLGLDGRGGGRFPVAAKWRAHLAAGGRGVVVANGAESEPASAKDAALLQLRPHL